MSEYVVKLPDVGEGIAEAEIVEWHVNVGDTITEDQVMVEVMTDKATVELPSPVTGVVTSVGAAVGEILQVGSPLIRIETNGSTGGDGGAPTTSATPHPPAQKGVTSDDASAEPAAPATEPALPPTPATPETSSAWTARSNAPLAAPAVRRRAAALGIDLADVTGTGPSGRVTHEDLDSQLPSAGARPSTGPTQLDDSVEAVPVVGLRRNIAQRMLLAKQHIPHFTYVEEIDLTEVERLRAELNRQRSEQRLKLTVLPFLMRAAVVAIADFPQVNARYDDENGVINRHRSVHLGVAAQTPKGLMVPVVRNAQALDLWDTAAEVARLAAAARDNTVTLEELTGSTITITSLGALGGIVSTPIINYPEVAIIGVNKIATRPVYIDGAVVPRQIMNLSSSFDHRVIDGADAAAFIQRIKTLLETPALLFID
jgi:2-oxoisovalerate dehydrogenase E2 component (dihydrolipoyl transacylase)